MKYFVQGANGAKYGPANLDILQKWVEENRILPLTTLIAEDTGMSLLAYQLTELTFPISVDVPIQQPPPVVQVQPIPPPFSHIQVGNITPLYGTPDPNGMPVPHHYQEFYQQSMNTSGTDGPIPEEVLAMKWSWGAFALPGIWLCTMNALWKGIMLICLELAIGFIHVYFNQSFPLPSLLIQLTVEYTIKIIISRRAYRIAWKYRRFESLDQFKDVQRIWNWAGLALSVLFLLIEMVQIIVFIIRY